MVSYEKAECHDDFGVCCNLVVLENREMKPIKKCEKCGLRTKPVLLAVVGEKTFRFRTYEEAGIHFDLTRERIRQITEKKTKGSLKIDWVFETENGPCPKCEKLRLMEWRLTHCRVDGCIELRASSTCYCRKHSTERHAIFVKNNKEKVSKKRKEWILNNIEKHREYHREYKRKHPVKIDNEKNRKSSMKNYYKMRSKGFRKTKTGWVKDEP